MAINNKHLWWTNIFPILIISLTACTGASVPNGTEVSPAQIEQHVPVTDSALMEQVEQNDISWQVVLNNWEIATDLRGTQLIQQYNGDVTQIQYQEVPSEGHTFLLVSLTIEKQVPGPATFKWEELTIIDENGAAYARHPNDTFLSNYNFPRIKSTDLTFGKEEGFICFEIPLDVSAGKLTLTYTSHDERVQIPLQ